MTDTTLSLAALEELAVRAFVACDTRDDSARIVARALALAEADGQKGHGASRIPFYAGQARSGKIDGHASPVVTLAGDAALRIDARNGFAHPAIELALDWLTAAAPKHGVAAVAIANSSHAGVAGHPVERLAEAGLVALFFANTPEAIAPWGGNRPLFGTNPIAFAAPRGAAPPLVIDMAMSEVARGKLLMAKNAGTPIPQGWALDADGRPTTDPEAAMAGSLLPLGGAKGAQLVLMVEILSAALTGSLFGYEASSFFTADGPPSRTGQFLLAIDPGPLSGYSFATRLEELVRAILDQPGTRLPGDRRLALRARAQADGVTIPASLHAEIQALARDDA